MKEDKQKLEVLEVIGLFWIFLGALVLFAVIFPPTLVGKITNLISGSILLIVGIFAFVKGRANRKKSR
ncbi:hypothetical protein NLD30_08880 [SCandidatus Aminicenantes bacterium Aminicenantia_JdfR_composite]|jgi:uncharacterized membrane protein HdeD (DUF308 family)|nr:hypothetical protein [SCandidatus Aminicenantes bacterium Aminicenantia_JdfR_composite]MCP2620813.1 hypothetical protein [Candidatus Aminicenantes bacterium AC-334-E05]